MKAHYNIPGFEFSQEGLRQRSRGLMSWNAEPDGMPEGGADERPRAGVRRAAPSLGFLGIVALTVAVAGTWATSALVLERHAGEQHRARMRRDVENHRAALARRVQIANQELYRAAEAFAGAPAVGRGVAQRDRDAVKEALHDLGEVHGWDRVFITGKTADDVVRSIISFERLNLNDDEYFVRGPFEVIFCRNVLIYFDKASRTRVIERLLDRLTPSGYFLLGRSETLSGTTDRVQGVSPSVYVPKQTQDGR